MSEHINPKHKTPEQINQARISIGNRLCRHVVIVTICRIFYFWDIWQRASEKINFFSSRWTKSVHFGRKTGLKKHQKRAKNGVFCKTDKWQLQMAQKYDGINIKYAVYRWTLFGLFKSTCFRYHYTRQVATRQEHSNLDQRSARQTATRQMPDKADSPPAERHVRGIPPLESCGIIPFRRTAALCRNSIWRCTYGSRYPEDSFGRSLP